MFSDSESLRSEAAYIEATRALSSTRSTRTAGAVPRGAPIRSATSRSLLRSSGLSSGTRTATPAGAPSPGSRRRTTSTWISTGSRSCGNETTRATRSPISKSRSVRMKSPPAERFSV